MIALIVRRDSQPLSRDFPYHADYGLAVGLFYPQN